MIRETQKINKYLSRVATISLLVAFSSLMTVWATLSVLKDQSQYVKKTCSDYSLSQDKEVTTDYLEGNRKLDGNHNGIPCENLVKKTR